jgi:uncharacterized protein
MSGEGGTALYLKRGKVLRNAVHFFVAAWLGVALGNVALAADNRAQTLNQKTIGLVASHAEQLESAVDIANAVDHTDGLRVLPILGRGGLQSINDLLFLRGVDVAMLSSDSLAFAKKNSLYSDETDKISYLAKIGNDRLVVLARPEFTTLQSLTGKRVAVGPTDSNEFVAADLVLGSFKLDFERVALHGRPAVDALMNGRVDAAIFSGDARDPDLAEIKKGSGLHVLPISLNDNLSETYSPAILSNADLPNLIPTGTVVETVASALVLAVFDWPQQSERYSKLEKFNDALFKNYFANLDNDNAINFLASVPGWKSYPNTSLSQ